MSARFTAYLVDARIGQDWDAHIGLPIGRMEHELQFRVTDDISRDAIVPGPYFIAQEDDVPSQALFEDWVEKRRQVEQCRDLVNENLRLCNIVQSSTLRVKRELVRT